jgi:hypothetical protein
LQEWRVWSDWKWLGGSPGAYYIYYIYTYMIGLGELREGVEVAVVSGARQEGWDGGTEHCTNAGE